MKYKQDWDRVQDRLTALWKGTLKGRPCISVVAPAGRKVEAPVRPEGLESFWTDPDWNVRRTRHQIETTWWGGESIPSCLLMCGWLQCLGGEPLYAEQTIWFKHLGMDFKRPPDFRMDTGNPSFRRHEAAYVALATAAGWDDFLVGQPCVLPANDLLSMLMSTEDFLVALCDEPDWMQKAIVQGAQVQAAIRQHLADRIRSLHRFWYGCAGWMPFWAPEPFMATQSDVSCMLSPDMYEQFVVPELEVYGKVAPWMWYHLDGGDARQHVPRLLSLPYLRVLQYTPAPCEPPNGPGHLAFYRQVQKAGKIVHIHLPPENVEPLVRELDPNLLMLHTWCRTVAEGEALLESADRWVCARG
ncbi:MAG: hypothetical protein A2340_15295 [Lentisphaerae bacterium RIFOXYB12_FULL_60_10]|nr:MAG: hypothetical protein A2340_15295 [Lentisphaerae bacterium RIFOXYB12_FULL_60_10]